MGKRSQTFQERMRAMGARLPPPPTHPDHKLIMAAAERKAEMDLGFRLRRQELLDALPSFLFARMQGGSGFPIANTIRMYFQEYFDRMGKAGPFSLPTSFNVVESFLSFSDRFLAFDLRDEREHLLRMHEYIEWYTASKFPEKPLTLTDILPEGIVYEYNMVSPLEDFAIETPDSKLLILGVALVRHRNELSGMIVAGEAPPYPSDSDITGGLAAQLSNLKPYPGKEGLKPDPSFSLNDRYLEELPGHARVILLARFDLSHSCYDVRYVNLDIGAGYVVLTDDRTVYGETTEEDDIVQIAERLNRYSSLFSALGSLLYLPAFFADQAARVVETKFATAIQTEKNRGVVSKTLKVFGPGGVPFFRFVRRLASNPPEPSDARKTVQPPDMEFQTSGYWRALGPGEIGEDKDGNPIVGKTWVERTDTWSARSLDSFVLSKVKHIVVGEDPGWIYVMRSGSHFDDVYKIGLTRRDTETRAAELSGATGVPTGFEVLAKWEVGDCRKAEAMIHRRLKSFRLSKRREFFRVNLQIIVSAINEEVVRLKAGL